MRASRDRSPRPTLATAMLCAALAIGVRPAAPQRPDRTRPAAGNTAPRAARVEHDLTYAEGFARDGRRNTLDLYLPAHVARPPLAIFVHGGTWTTGDKELHAFLGEGLAAQGLAAAVINTRMSPFVEPAEMVADCARAVGWLHRHADDHGFDPDRIVLVGHSSGGHLVSWLALDDDRWRIAETPRAALRGVVSLSGVYDVRPRHRALDAVFGRDAAQREAASPMRHVQGSAPPFLVVWADGDMHGLGLSARAFGHSLRWAGVPVTLRELDGRNHVDYLFRMRDPASPELAEIGDFVRRVVQAPQPPATLPAVATDRTAAGRVLQIAAAAGELPVALHAPSHGAATRWLALAVDKGEHAAAERLARRLCMRGCAVALVDCRPLLRDDLADRQRLAAFERTLDRLAAADAGLALPPSAPALGAVGGFGWLVVASGSVSSGRVLLGATAAASVARGILQGDRGHHLRGEHLFQRNDVPLLVVTSAGDPKQDRRDARPLLDLMVRRDDCSLRLSGATVLERLLALEDTDDLLVPVVAAFAGL